MKISNIFQRYDDNAINAKVQASWTRMAIINSCRRGTRTNTNLQTQRGDRCATKENPPGPGGEPGTTLPAELTRSEMSVEQTSFIRALLSPSFKAHGVKKDIDKY